MPKFCVDFSKTTVVGNDKVGSLCVFLIGYSNTVFASIHELSWLNAVVVFVDLTFSVIVFSSMNFCNLVQSNQLRTLSKCISLHDFWNPN